LNKNTGATLVTHSRNTIEGGMMISLEFLEKVELFNGLEDKQLRAVQACCDIEEYERGQQLFAEGDASTHLWIVKKGAVALRKEEADISTQPPVSFTSKKQTFGWSCFAPPYQYRLSGYCESRTCKIVKIEKDCLQNLFEQDEAFGHQVVSQLLTVVGTQFHQYQDEIARRMGEEIIHQW